MRWYHATNFRTTSQQRVDPSSPRIRKTRQPPQLSNVFFTPQARTPDTILVEGVDQSGRTVVRRITQNNAFDKLEPRIATPAKSTRVEFDFLGRPKPIAGTSRPVTLTNTSGGKGQLDSQENLVAIPPKQVDSDEVMLQDLLGKLSRVRPLPADSPTARATTTTPSSTPKFTEATVDTFPTTSGETTANGGKTRYVIAGSTLIRVPEGTDVSEFVEELRRKQKNEAKLAEEEAKEEKQRVEEEKRREEALQEQKRLDEERAKIEKHRIEQEKQRKEAELERRRLAEERRKEAEIRRRAQEEREKAEKQRLEDEKKQADLEKQRIEEENERKTQEEQEKRLEEEIQESEDIKREKFSSKPQLKTAADNLQSEEITKETEPVDISELEGKSQSEETVPEEVNSESKVLAKNPLEVVKPIIEVLTTDESEQEQAESQVSEAREAVDTTSVNDRRRQQLRERLEELRRRREGAPTVSPTSEVDPDETKVKPQELKRKPAQTFRIRHKAPTGSSVTVTKVQPDETEESDHAQLSDDIRDVLRKRLEIHRNRQGTTSSTVPPEIEVTEETKEVSWEPDDPRDLLRKRLEVLRKQREGTSSTTAPPVTEEAKAATLEEGGSSRPSRIQQLKKRIEELNKQRLGSAFLIDADLEGSASTQYVSKTYNELIASAAALKSNTSNATVEPVSDDTSNKTIMESAQENNTTEVTNTTTESSKKETTTKPPEKEFLAAVEIISQQTSFGDSFPTTFGFSTTESGESAAATTDGAIDYYSDYDIDVVAEENRVVPSVEQLFPALSETGFHQVFPFPSVKPEEQVTIDTPERYADPYGSSSEVSYMHKNDPRFDNSEVYQQMFDKEGVPLFEASATGEGIRPNELHRRQLTFDELEENLTKDLMKRVMEAAGPVESRGLLDANEDLRRQLEETRTWVMDKVKRFLLLMMRTRGLDKQYEEKTGNYIRRRLDEENKEPTTTVEGRTKDGKVIVQTKSAPTERTTTTTPPSEPLTKEDSERLERIRRWTNAMEVAVEAFEMVHDKVSGDLRKREAVVEKRSGANSNNLIAFDDEDYSYERERHVTLDPDTAHLLPLFTAATKSLKTRPAPAKQEAYPHTKRRYGSYSPKSYLRRQPNRVSRLDTRAKEDSGALAKLETTVKNWLGW